MEWNNPPNKKKQLTDKCNNMDESQCIILSERSQSQKVTYYTYYMILYDIVGKTKLQIQKQKNKTKLLVARMW